VVLVTVIVGIRIHPRPSDSGPRGFRGVSREEITMKELLDACSRLRAARSGIDEASYLVDHIDFPREYALIIAAADAVNAAHNAIVMRCTLSGPTRH